MVTRKSCESRLLRVPGLAQLLGTSEQAVRNALSRGQEGRTIPRSFKLGIRRVWLRRDVVRWLNTHGRDTRR
jgi:predicted DNA-binding transcriptional regulator AlpA